MNEATHSFDAGTNDQFLLGAGPSSSLDPVWSGRRCLGCCGEEAGRWLIWGTAAFLAFPSSLFFFSIEPWEILP